MSKKINERQTDAIVVNSFNSLTKNMHIMAVFSSNEFYNSPVSVME